MKNNIINNSLNCKIIIYGNNNTIICNSNKINGQILIGEPDSICNNCKIIIGKDSTSDKTMIRLMEDNTILTIGEDCMFSTNTRIWASDTHCIFDQNNNLKNIGKYVHIGNHVWFGENVTILKNTNISDNSVIGLNSVVHGNFDKNGSIICGNPAKCISIGNNWSRLRPQQYLNQLNKYE